MKHELYKIAAVRKQLSKELESPKEDSLSKFQWGVNCNSLKQANQIIY